MWMFIPNFTVCSVECYTFSETIVMPLFTPNTVNGVDVFLSLLQLSIIITLTMVRGVITPIFSVKGILICGFPFVLSLGGGLNRQTCLHTVDPKGTP